MAGKTKFEQKMAGKTKFESPQEMFHFGSTREAYLKGKSRYSTVDLLVQTSLDQLLLILKIFFTYLTKQCALFRR
jgi:hypothetical protein